MLDKYRHYFDIDPEYFPQVNEAIITKNPEIWKKYYPHETFVKLLKDTISVLSRRQKVSVWVEGAYGTGKSHAVLTLKKLLDASEEDTKEYFEKYSDQLSNDLFNQFQQLKNDGKILTVHRYGSSNIRGDANLVFALQQSIVAALDEHGFGTGKAALKDSTIDWLSDNTNKAYFNSLVAENYSDLFGGDDVDAIIEKLKSYSGDSLSTLMNKIMKVADERHFTALTMDVDGLVEWIEDVIKENELKAIVFIWDEFTEYFRNNMRALTGFQKIVDLSGSVPFYMFIVTHNVTHIFPETDQDWKKILGRFVNPICNIELPENMAFRLMGAAMEKNKDPQVFEDWNDTVDELYDRTNDSRKLVKEKARITDEEMKNILPIHPYTALLLKHISSAFDSNQRSMFDFIKNDRGDEIKGFQWFIDNYGPYDENPLLTVDMLWDFFYEKGKEYLSHDIRSILDCYSRAEAGTLPSKDHARVLKTILLLEAISQRVGDAVELFIPNEKNVNNAFEGSDMENQEATRIADSLVRAEILYKKPLGAGKTQYSALVNASDSAAVDKLKEDVRKKTTSQLVLEGDINSAISLNGALKLRYELKSASSTDFKQVVNRLREQAGELGNKISAVVTYAKDDAESAVIGKAIKAILDDDSYNVLFIDASITPFGEDLFEQYVDAMANSMYQRGKQNTIATQYENNAKDVLRKWRSRITDGEFIIYSKDKPEGERVSNLEQLLSEMVSIDRSKYPCGLETGQAVTDTMWQANSLPSGVECGAKENVQGAYRSANPATKLEFYIGEGIWQSGAEYWESNKTALISKIKIYVKEMMDEAFKNEGRISISRIYDELKCEPFGIMPCNLTAFVIGFILKEYTDGSYTWTDGTTSDPLSVDKLKEMVSEIIKHQITPIPRYKEKYIGTLTPAEKMFNEASAEIFEIPVNLCSSVENTREHIRQKMKELSFPIWCIENVLSNYPSVGAPDRVKELLRAYSGIANNINYGGKTDSDIALFIGQMFIDDSQLREDMKTLVTKENCIAGMQEYLKEYENGELLRLSESVGDDGQYINKLKKKFEVDAANWVWNQETAEQKIKEVILEYKIVEVSNEYIPKTISFDGCIREWCDKTNFIKISFLYARNYWEDLSRLMEMLYDLKKTGQLLDSKREEFLEQIRINGEAFNEFYTNQVGLFKKACSFLIGDMADDEIAALYQTLPVGMFTDEKANYQSTVQQKVEDFKNSQGATKLRNLWNSKTGTISPKEWSDKYRTPALSMVKEEDIPAAKIAFNAINKKQQDSSTIEKTIEFIEHADFFEAMSDQAKRDEAFTRTIIKSYAVMLTDVDEVRDYLTKMNTADPYDWYGMLSIEDKLREMAEFKYNESGCNVALERIDSMSVEDAKKYLKDLIKNNMIVGMEIIKNS